MVFPECQGMMGNNHEVGRLIQSLAKDILRSLGQPRWVGGENGWKWVVGLLPEVVLLVKFILFIPNTKPETSKGNFCTSDFLACARCGWRCNGSERCLAAPGMTGMTWFPQVLILSAISIHPVRTVTERHEVRRFFCWFLSYFFQFPALTRLIPPILLVIFLENKYCRLSTSGFKAFSGPCVLGEYSCTRFLTIMESARYAACNEDEQVRPSGRSWIYRWHPNLHQTFSSP